MTPTAIIKAALAYLSCGLSVIPIAADGTKAPLCAWTPYQTVPITRDDVRRLFPPGCGLAVIGGAVSGGLEVLDFDHVDAFPRWLALLQDTDPELAEVVAQLPLIATPAGGRHLYYRCSEVAGNQKLATAAQSFRDCTGKTKRTLIETRGERGYVLAPPSPPSCHEAKLPYRHLSGVDLANTPTVTPGERETLLATARLLDEVPAAPPPPERPQTLTTPTTGDRPGDDWAARTDWDDVLTPHGWQRAGQTSGQDAWRRPGKTKGISATCNGEHFYCHTTSAPPLDAGRAYDKLGLFAALDHQGDIRAAVRALAADGYGEQRPPRQPAADPFDDEADPFDDPDFYADPERDPADPLDPAAADGPTPDLLLDAVALAAPLPPLDFLIDELGLVAGGGAPHLIAGYGFSGKTLACQALLVSLAAGRPVWGQYRSNQTYRVAHVDLEQGNRLTRARYQRLARGMGVHLPQLGDVLVAAVMPADLRLTRACATRWRRIMAERDLVVIDSLRAAAAGSDENSSDIRQHLDLLGELADETGCRALVIVHARKPSQDSEGGLYAIRGSSAIYDGADSVLLFGAAKGEPIAVSHVKARSTGQLAPDLALVVEDVPAEQDEPDQTPGLRVAVRGAEVLHERRREAASVRLAEQTGHDAERVRAVLRGHHEGLSGRQLQSLSELSRRRYDRAMVEIGSQIETFPGPHRSVLHRLGGSV